MDGKMQEEDRKYMYWLCGIGGRLGKMFVDVRSGVDMRALRVRTPGGST